MQSRMKLVATVGIAVAAIFLSWTAIGRTKNVFELVSTIAFSSTRDDPSNPFPILAAEIYLMNEDGTNQRRLTENMVGDFFAVLSPDGKKIVFDSTRNQASGEPRNTSDLFVMNTDGTEQTYLIRGSSATWSPDSKNIAFHASASGTGLPIKTDPGAATSDSDIFVINVDDVLNGVAGRKNITNSPLMIDDDADWSPDGQRIAFTSHSIFDNPLNSVTTEIYVINPDGTGLTRLTFNDYEERAPSWSPDGSRIVFMASVGTHPGTPGQKFEICVMNADGTNFVQLTDNGVFDGTPTFSPDGQKIVFHRGPAPQQMWMMNADGTGQMQLTFPPGFNNLANWGVLRVRSSAP
jgi:Tol biopolymer transport system component